MQFRMWSDRIRIFVLSKFDKCYLKRIIWFCKYEPVFVQTYPIVDRTEAHQRLRRSSDRIRHDWCDNRWCKADSTEKMFGSTCCVTRKRIKGFKHKYRTYLIVVVANLKIDRSKFLYHTDRTHVCRICRLILYYANVVTYILRCESCVVE
jgi:hypothetical protein